MPTHHESFFLRDAFIYVGHDKAQPFPRISFGALKNAGKKLYPFDPDLKEVEGVPVLSDLDALPGPVDAALVEIPAEETAAWVERLGAAGVKHLWIHMGSESPEALAAAQKYGMDVHSGTCAAMYTVPGVSYHSIHKFFMKLAKKY